MAAVAKLELGLIRLLQGNAVTNQPAIKSNPEDRSRSKYCVRCRSIYRLPCMAATISDGWFTRWSSFISCTLYS